VTPAEGSFTSAAAPAALALTAREAEIPVNGRTPPVDTETGLERPPATHLMVVATVSEEVAEVTEALMIGRALYLDEASVLSNETSKVEA